MGLLRKFDLDRFQFSPATEGPSPTDLTIWMISRRKGLSFLASIGVAAVALACAAPDSSQATHPPGQAELAHLSIVAIGPYPDLAPLFVAERQGFFTKEGLDVSVNPNGGANTVNLIASGQADIADYTTSSPLVYAMQGKAPAVIWAGGNIAWGALVGNRNVTSVSQLRTMGDCHLGVSSPGSSVYGNALLYQQALGLSNCQLVVSADIGTLTNAIVAGSVSAGVVGISYALTAVARGAHFLIDPRSTEFKGTYGSSTYVSSVMWGNAANLASKRIAVVKFLRAMHDASVFVSKSTPSQIAAILKKDSAFDTLPESQLIDAFESGGIFAAIGMNVTPNRPNFLSPVEWNQALQQISTYGIPRYSPTDPAVQYGKVVDMSYYTQAATAAPAWTFPATPSPAPECWLGAQGCPKT
jgi:NitT/TauT family transport system substrate-binding protein